MKRRFLFLFVIIWAGFSLVAQQPKIIKHTVEAGETIYSIARKYRVTPYKLMKNNPGLGSTIKPGQVIFIPVEEDRRLDSLKAGGNYVAFKYHTVKENETVFSISKQYRTTVEDIVKVNKIEDNNIKLGQIIIIPILPDPERKIDTTRYTFYYVKPKEGKWRVAYEHGITVEELERLNPEIKDQPLKINQKLVVPKNRAVTVDCDEEHFRYYEVKPLETIFSLTKRFNISEEDLIKYNPSLTEGLKAGQILKIPKQTPENKRQENGKFFFHKVQPKETLYSLTKKFNISAEDLIKYNPQLKDGLKAGQILRFPRPDFTIVFDLNSPFFFRLERLPSPGEYTTNLLKNLKKDRTYKVAVLLPLNVKKSDTVTDKSCPVLYKNKILSYYAGIRMAIDSLKNLGLDIRYDVFDTQASPYVTDKILTNNDLTDYDFVLGPVYPKVIDKALTALEPFNTPLAVPMYPGRNSNVLINTLTDSVSMAQHIVSYINQAKTDDNIVIITDENARTTADSLAVSVGSLNRIEARKSKHGFWIKDTDLQKQLKKGKNNILIMATDDYSLIANVLSLSEGFSDKYSIDMYMLEDKHFIQKLDIKKMAAVHFTFPSRDLKIPDPRLTKAVTDKYGFYPDNTFINGYDTTFDLFLRLANADNLFDGLKKFGKTKETSRIYLYGFTPGKGFGNIASYILRVNDQLDLDIID